MSEESSDIFLSPIQATPESNSGEEAIVQSIERSRKRHLSEGLLRGDLVSDRLLVQEASASPLLKKSRASPLPESRGEESRMALTMAEFRKYMDENVNKKLGDVESSLGDLTKTVARVNKNVKANTAKIDKHEELIVANRDSIATIREEISKMREIPIPVPDAGSSASSGSVVDKAYDNARRSVRIWPVHGTTREEMWNSTEFFLKQNLELEGVVRESMIESVVRAEIPSGPGVRLEVATLSPAII